MQRPGWRHSLEQQEQQILLGPHMTAHTFEEGSKQVAKGIRRKPRSAGHPVKQGLLYLHHNLAIENMLLPKPRGNVAQTDLIGRG